jgi:hypothetical protein
LCLWYRRPFLSAASFGDKMKNIVKHEKCQYSRNNFIKTSDVVLRRCPSAPVRP